MEHVERDTIDASKPQFPSKGIIMITIVKATYRDGALTPEIPLDLEDGDEVMLTVEHAPTIRDLIEHERQRPLPEEKRRKLEEIRKRCAILMKNAKDGPSAVEIGDWLYDENGLPK